MLFCKVKIFARINAGLAAGRNGKYACASVIILHLGAVVAIHQTVISKRIARIALIAPYTLTDDVLDIGDARAYSASLGLTAKGRLNLVSNVCDLQGTIVPAYFFNSLLGSIPFVGKLFSPESGGGVFAATYSITGNCDDPSVGVNPLAALTPGFLRGLFEAKGSASTDNNARGATH